MMMTTDRSSDAAGETPRPSGRSSRPPRSRTTGASSSTSSNRSTRGIPSAPPRSSDLDLVVGRVGRPHGLDGSFYVVDAAPELPATGGLVSGRRIVRRAGTVDRPILRLEGSSSRGDAEALRGFELTLPRDDSMLEEGEFWAEQLEGCSVMDGPTAVGFVRRMSALPSVEVLEVDRPDGSELLIPLVGDCIRSIDVEARRIDVDLGFLGEG